MGSNTEKVVRYAKCPVITVKEKVSLDSIKNIVFASNLQDEQTALVKKLKVIQEITDATLHLVKVNTPNHFSTQRQMMKEFARFIEKHDISNASTSIYNEATEEDGVLYFAEDLGACMIAMGTHGRTGILHLLSGSIAEDLVNHARVPVWTLSQKASR
ncbi:MAG: nucleotide-binding universal stress UspA family protein [Roseivirga sp.]